MEIESKYLPRMTREERIQLEGGSTYNRALDNFVRNEVTASIGTLVDKLIPHIESDDDLEDFRDLIEVEDWVEAAEEGNACIVKTNDNDFFHFHLGDLNTIEIDDPTDAMINFAALAKHLGLDVDGYVFEEDFNRVLPLLAENRSENAYLNSISDACADGEDVLEQLAVLAEHQKNHTAQELISGALRNADKADKLLGDFVNPDYNAADSYSTEKDAAQAFCDSNRIEPHRSDVYEKFLVSSWFGDKLEEKGCAVVEIGNLHIWGRTTFGQMVSMDGVVQEIFKENMAPELDKAIAADFPEVAARIDQEIAAEQAAEKSQDGNAPSPN